MPEFQTRDTASDGIWLPYTPTLTNITLGTGGTCVGRYTRIGNTILFQVIVTLGVGGTLTGVPSASLPVEAAAFPSTVSDGTVHLINSGINTYDGNFLLGSTTGVSAYGCSANGAFVALSATVPFTWDSTDQVKWAGTYEAAA